MVFANPYDPDRDPDRLLPHCWAHQDCRSCLSAKQYHCSWCAESSVCIANPATWPLLTPIHNRGICPSEPERWELRGNELGCNVSTITFLSVLVSVLSTLAVVCLIYGLTRAWKWSQRRWKGWIQSLKEYHRSAAGGVKSAVKRPWEGWAKRRRREGKTDERVDGEREALLGQEDGI